MEESGSRTRWLVTGCGILALLAICCVSIVGVIYVSGGLQPLLAMVGLAGKGQAATYAPADTPFFMAVELDLQQVVNFKKVWSVYEKSPPVQSRLEDLKKDFAGSSGCDFDADVAPWWGPDMAIFLTDARSLSSGGALRGGRSAEPPNFVAAIGTRDPGKARAALDKCTFKDQSPSEETYRGNKVRLYDSGSAVAVIGNYVLISATKDAMHAAIDATSGGSKRLAENADYKNMLARLPSNRAATMYVATAPLLDALKQSTTGIQFQSFEQLQFYQSVGASLSFAENGLRLDAAVALNKDKMPACLQQQLQTTSPNQILKAVPANVYFVASASNLKASWDCSLSFTDPTTQAQFQNIIGSFQKQTGLDLEADLLSWLTGEFAIAMLPSEPFSRGMPGVGALVLIEAKDQALVNSKMARVSGALGKQGVTFRDEKVNGISMKVGSLGSPLDPTAPSIGYGIVGNYLVIGGPRDALGNAVDAPKEALSGDSTFKTVQAALPARNNGCFYISVTGIEKLISDNLSSRERTEYQKNVQPWLKPVKAIGMASEVGKTDFAVSTVFVYIPGD